MENKKIGILLIIIGIILTLSFFSIKITENKVTKQIIQEKGTCFLDDGTCLHEEENNFFYILGWTITAILISLGIYLILFEKSQKEIISTLKEQKEIKTHKEKFDILLKGLDDDEKKIITAIKEQDGITQQTLRIRADMHKSKLSIVLNGLEKKNLIKRIEKGKTTQVFLKIHL